MEKLKKAIDHNRYLAIALVIGLVVCVAFVGCQPKVRSLLDPQATVTAEELQREWVQIEADFEAKAEEVEIAQAELQRKAELRAKIVEIAGGFAMSAARGDPISAGAAVGGMMQIAALGLVWDNRRKDKVIKKRKA